MDAVFFGSTENSLRVLKALHKRGVSFPVVITKAPKEKGRGLKRKSTPVGKWAGKEGLNLLEVDNPNVDEVRMAVENSGVNIFILVAYGAILKNELLSLVDYPLNVHPSLLPKYRGVSPVARALMNGDSEVGLSIFLMDEGVDTGDIVYRDKIHVKRGEVRTELKRRLFNSSVKPLYSILDSIHRGEELERIPQEDKGSYTSWITRDELKIDWSESSLSVSGKIRGLSKKPGAYSEFRDKKIKLLRSEVKEEEGKWGSPGEILGMNGSFEVQCGEGTVKILNVKVQGKSEVDAESFINGYHVKKGERLR